MTFRFCTRAVSRWVSCSGKCSSLFLASADVRCFLPGGEGSCEVPACVDVGSQTADSGLCVWVPWKRQGCTGSDGRCTVQKGQSNGLVSSLVNLIVGSTVFMWSSSWDVVFTHVLVESFFLPWLSWTPRNPTHFYTINTNLWINKMQCGCWGDLTCRTLRIFSASPSQIRLLEAVWF